MGCVGDAGGEEGKDDKVLRQRNDVKDDFFFFFIVKDE